MQSLRSNVYRKLRSRILHRFRGSTYPFGFDARGWMSLLRENDFAVDREYWRRAALATLASIPNSVHGAKEDKIYGPVIMQTEIKPPLFILGHARSGTSHLHRLLILDDQFAYPDVYETHLPHSFLSAKERHVRLVEFLLPKTRPMDNMIMNVHAPEEDEFAMLFLTRCSPYAGFMFPRHWDRYQQYLTFRKVSDAELGRWKAGFAWFLKKLTWKHGRRLLLKSPPHTARIRMLLEMFPDAEFIHIHRDPYTVFQSTHNLFLKVTPHTQFQHADSSQLTERIIKQYNDMYDAFFEERTLIPSKRFHEIRFEDLERDPIGQLEAIYLHFNLAGFKHLEPRLRLYVDLIKEYRKNPYPELSPAVRQRIADSWGRSFSAWGYPP